MELLLSWELPSKSLRSAQKRPDDGSSLCLPTVLLQCQCWGGWATGESKCQCTLRWGRCREKYLQGSHLHLSIAICPNSHSDANSGLRQLHRRTLYWPENWRPQLDPAGSSQFRLTSTSSIIIVNFQSIQHPQHHHSCYDSQTQLPLKSETLRKKKIKGQRRKTPQFTGFEVHTYLHIAGTVRGLSSSVSTQ